MSSYSFVTIYPSDLEYAVSQGTITEKQSANLWSELTSRSEKRFTTTLETLGYISGALLIIGSLTWFTSLAYDNADSLALFWLGLFYVAGFGATGVYFWNQTPTKNDYSKIVGGIFLTIAAAVTPVATFALDRYFNWHYFYRGSVESATLVGASLIALSIADFSPLAIPLNLGVWTWVITAITPFAWSHPDVIDVYTLTLILGAINLIVGFSLKISKPTNSYSFWFYLFGLAQFCGSLNQEFYGPWYNFETFKIVYFVINFVIFVSALPLNQAMFLLFGGYGICTFIYNQLYLYGNQTVDCSVSALFGTIIIVSAYVVDKRNENSDYPFWAYLFGVATFESAISWLFNFVYWGAWGYGLVYFGLNIALTLLYIPTQRFQFVLGGVTGVMFYVNWLLWSYASSYALPLMITLVGLVLIGFAVWLSRSKITKQIRRVRRSGSAVDEQDLL